MPAITQPGGSIRLTNVSIVRLKKAGVRLEVAAYSNSVGAFRAGIESDADAVLQTRAVFSCAKKGTLAPRADIEAAFGAGVSSGDAAVLVLKHGDVQEGEVERGARLAALFRDVAAIVAAKCADPRTARPYPPALVERALREAGFSLAVHRGAKEQALRAVALLAARPDVLPIARARMRLRVTVPAAGECGGGGGGGGGDGARARGEETQLSTRRRRSPAPAAGIPALYPGGCHSKPHTRRH
jgi:ribosome maturation protein SDO1